MIKQIQLRGISRTPSDRMTADGGCAESLNVHLDDNEIAPTLKPTVINGMTDERGVRMFPGETYSTLEWEAVFIHKTPTFERAIIKYVQSGTTKIGVWNGSSFDSFLSLNSGETFVRCVGLGNTLGVVTDSRVAWVLMKDGSYSPLGSKIPFPEFIIANKEIPASSTSGSEVIREKDGTAHVIATDGESVNETLLNNLWNQIDEAIATNKEQGVYNYQQFAVVALRLFDGTRIISTPVLLAPGFEQPIEFLDRSTASAYKITFKTAYKIFFKLYQFSDDSANWREIIDGVEVYLSQQIAANIDKTKGRYHVSGTDTTITFGADDYSYQEQYLNACENFYRVYSSELSDQVLAELEDGIILDTKRFMSGDTLTTSGVRLNTLSDMNHYEVIFDRATLYNSKIIASGISEKVSMNMSMPIATHFYDPQISGAFKPAYTPDYDGDDKRLEYRLTFHLRDSSGREFAIRDQNSYFYFGPRALDGSNTSSPTIVTSNAYGLIFCPDPRAFEVDIEATLVSQGEGTTLEETVTTVTLPMTEHPNLSCSYWYGGVDKELLSFVTETDAYEAGDLTYIDNRPNKVYVSEMDNPFVFPIASRYTMSSRVIGCAIATNALSTGQFGQFPVYVFTEDGIWAMETASDGMFVATKPLSREVCTNADSITPIDNAVVFITAKAVMLISGSQITNLSPNMNGEHFALDVSSDEYALIEGGAWEQFVDVLTDSTHFLSFMEDAQIAYDYTGDRLLFINEDEDYQYVFMLKTNTWHKIMLDGYTYIPSISSVMNAYPDSYVNARISSIGHYVWNLATVLNVTSTENRKGIIITRSIDLGEPDIRKTIKSIRIRGQYNRNDVKYILLGSFDGHTWKMLTSLRGGSYKLFRMIVLTNLSPTERISWIDIDYESRFATKLR